MTSTLSFLPFFSFFLSSLFPRRDDFLANSYFHGEYVIRHHSADNTKQVIDDVNCSTSCSSISTADNLQNCLQTWRVSYSVKKNEWKCSLFKEWIYKRVNLEWIWSENVYFHSFWSDLSDHSKITEVTPKWVKIKISLQIHSFINSLLKEWTFSLILFFTDKSSKTGYLHFCQFEIGYLRLN